MSLNPLHLRTDMLPADRWALTATRFRGQVQVLSIVGYVTSPRAANSVQRIAGSLAFLSCSFIA